MMEMHRSSSSSSSGGSSISRKIVRRKAQRSFLPTLFAALLFFHEVPAAAALTYPGLSNTCGENGVGAGDMQHKRTFNHYCLCPIGTKCEGPEGECYAHGDDDKDTLDGKLEIFHIKSCPTCRCSDLPDDWEQTPFGSQIIVALDGSEGMASWRYSVAEMIYTARMLSCRIVLPCVHGGRLVPCHLPKAASIGTYIDLALLKTYWPRIMPYSELMKLDEKTKWRDTASRVLCISHRCGQKGFENVRLDGLRSKNGLGVLPTEVPVVRHYNRPIPAWINAFLKAERIIVNDHVTLMTTWFKGAVRLSTLGNSQASSYHEDFGVTRVWRFAPSVYHQIQRIKLELNLADTYMALHWRSERTECKYKECADNVVHGVKLALDIYRTETRPLKEGSWNVAGKRHCLLISDIPYNPERSLWGPFAVTEFADEGRMDGMKYVMDAFGVSAPTTGDWGGCGKLDALKFLDDVDTGLLSLYDKILGNNSTEFHTCQGNKRSSVCGVCARTQSQFAKEIFDARLKQRKKKTTHGSWPSAKDATLILATGAKLKPKKNETSSSSSSSSSNGGESTRMVGVVPADFNQEDAMRQLKERSSLAFGCDLHHADPFQQAAATLISSKPSTSSIVLRRTGSILWTFPGAGNTWCRALLEGATGFLTGSVYNDPSLKKFFKAEGKMVAKKVIAIKAHPNVKGWDAQRLQSKFGPNIPLILVVRDPYKSFWSEGQRRITRSLRQKSRGGENKITGKSHAMQVTKIHLTSAKNWMKWQELAVKLANDYTQMFRDYKTMIKGGSAHVFVPYEDLKNKGTRVQAFHRMLQFVGEGFDPQKEKCAFASAENDSIHRAAPTAESATFEDAFPHELACQLWAILLPGKAIAEQLGYPWTYQPPTESCDGVHFDHSQKIPAARPLTTTAQPCSLSDDPPWCSTSQAQCGTYMVQPSVGAGLPGLALNEICKCKCG